MKMGRAKAEEKFEGLPEKLIEHSDGTKVDKYPQFSLELVSGSYILTEIIIVSLYERWSAQLDF